MTVLDRICLVNAAGFHHLHMNTTYTRITELTGTLLNALLTVQTTTND